MKKCKVIKWCCIVVALCLVVAFVWRKNVKFREKCRWRTLMASSEALGRLPRRDISGWMAEYGVHEPDLSSPAGRARLQAERRLLPEREGRFRILLKGLPVVYTNGNQNAAEDFLKEVDCCLDGLSRSSCEEVLKAVAWDGSGWDVDVTLRAVSSEGAYSSALKRYCQIFGRFADLIWERAGDSYAAAEADRRTFNVLKTCGRIFPAWQSAANVCLEEWKEKRCDNVDSNYCRSFREREALYRSHWESYVRMNPSMQNVVTDWYCWHLKWARNALRREPKWSPNFGRNGGSGESCSDREKVANENQ